MEKIRRVLDKKLDRLDPQIHIISPGSGIVDSSTQAAWMINLLSQTYVNHAIARVPEQVQKSIETGDTACWFAVRDEEPIGIASLIKQSDGSVELGRAAALEKSHGIGGILMLMAALNHLQTNNSPLIAEVRTSDEFGGIAGGAATQKICFDHVGLIPHALVPAFHHGSPDRNEQFAFSSSQRLHFSEAMVIPEDSATRKLLWATAVTLAQSASELVQVQEGAFSPITKGWTRVEGPPFSLIVPDGKPSSLESTVAEGEKVHPFTLLPVEMSPAMTGAIIVSLNAGFVPCGVDKSVGEQGHPVLLLGRLRKGTLLAPMRLLDGVISPDQKNAMERVDEEFRKTV